ncbi:MAG: methyltransferase [Marinirhabdus sp.]|nr:methyltransferase [Marinirhabdus sp.]
MYENSFPKKRYKHTLQFLKTHIDVKEQLLDLGVENPFSELLKAEGYQVTNTRGEDLDLDVSAVKNTEFDVLTAFEIFEHMVNPFDVLREAKASKLVASVPLKLWFASAYKSKTDERDRHYHEFEDWQFDWLLEKSGWIIKDRKKFTNPIRKIGFRPILRRFTPRYYLVYAERAR